MKKTLLSLIVFASVGFSSGTKNEEWGPVFSRINSEVNSSSKAYSSLKYATEKIGHRLTGSHNGKLAEEYAYNLLKSYGYENVRFQPFEVESWMRDTVSLAIAPANSDNFQDLEVVSLAHSPVEANVDAEIIDVGNGLEEDFEAVKERVKGKIALANIGLVEANGKKNLHRSEKTALAIRYGAVGIIMVNQAPGKILLTGTASVTGALIAIPAVCISNESGKKLRAWIVEEGPLHAHVDMANFSKKINARNVIATLKGRTDEKIIIGGHLDSWDLATGAIDNGIGSFAVLDIARTLKALKIKPARTIEFVLFMGEEQGLLGSKYFAKQLSGSPHAGKVRAMINLDMTNNPKGTNGFGRPELESILKSVGESVKKIDSSFTNSFVNRAGLHSDHQPFMLEGFPIVGFSGSLAPGALQCYHADCDDFGLVNKREIENTVRVATMYLYALANIAELPTRRFTSEETRDYLIKQGLEKELVLGNDWRW